MILRDVTREELPSILAAVPLMISFAFGMLAGLPPFFKNKRKLAMRLIVTVALLMLSTVLNAAVIQIPLPPQLANVGQGAARACVGVAFNADGSIAAMCRTETSVPCSGRGCTPVYYIADYRVTWSDAGETTVQCSVTRHHAPQADTVTYAAGFDATSCPALVFNTGTTVIIDGSTYFYVTTDAASGRELVNSSAWGFLYTP